MRQSIEIKQSNSTELIFLDTVSCIEYCDAKISERYKWRPEIKSKGWFSNSRKAGIIDTKYENTIIESLIFTEDGLDEVGLFLRNGITYHKAYIIFHTNKSSHKVTFNDYNMADYHTTIEQLKQLTNIVLTIKQ